VDDRARRAHVAANGGLLPTGVLQLVIVTSGVIFTYATVELVGTAADETENLAKIHGSMSSSKGQRAQGVSGALHHPNVVSFMLGLLGLIQYLVDHLRLEHLRGPDRRRLGDVTRALQQPDEVRDAQGFTAP
jgi:hypothetical protein